MILKSIDYDKPIGYLRYFIDGDNVTLLLTLTSLKLEGEDVFAVLFSVAGEELARSVIDVNGATVSLAGKCEKVDLLLATKERIISYANISGERSKEFYFNRFLEGEKATCCVYNNVYDDDAIATENYYLLEEKCDLLKGGLGGSFSIKNELPFGERKSEKEEIKKANNCEENQDDDNKKSCLDLYYKKVQKKVDGIVLRYRSSRKLTKSLPNTRFFSVKNDENRLFGICYEKANPSYFIYAIFGNKSDGVPAKLSDKGCFVPCSIFDLSGEGYWCVFQDAKTGALVVKE